LSVGLTTRTVDASKKSKEESEEESSSTDSDTDSDSDDDSDGDNKKGRNTDQILSLMTYHQNSL